MSRRLTLGAALVSLRMLVSTAFLLAAIKLVSTAPIYFGDPIVSERMLVSTAFLFAAIMLVSTTAIYHA